MTTGVTRREALAVVASAILARRAGAQTLHLVTVLDDQIPTADGFIGGVTTAKPEGVGLFPIVILAVEDVNSPLVADALNRLRKEGVLAVAPDLFAGDPPDSTVMQRLDATRDWAGRNGGDIARLGIIGFGPGGRAAWLYAAFSPALKAAIAWGGPMQGTTSPARPVTALEVAGQLNAPLLGLYGKNDGTPQRILLDAEARAKKAGKTADIVSYVGAGQNFAVPGAASFDEAATIDGWQRTLKWLRDHGVS